MTKKEVKETLEAHRDNIELLRELISVCNGWDGSLESYQVHEFDDEFFDTYFEGNPTEAVRATFFGEIKNWNDEYIRFNGYGNLETLNEWQYEKELKENADEIIERAQDLTEEIDLKEIITRHTVIVSDKNKKEVKNA